LIAHDHSNDEIREDLGADSLGYLSIEGLRGTAAKDLKRGICDACFSDEYPVPIEPQEGVPQLTLFRAASDEDPAG
jgi:amidophosphoribosyltransferase